MKDENQIVAVRCKGMFTEWYSPFFRDPFADDHEFREWYSEIFVHSKYDFSGPSLNKDDDGEVLTNDDSFLSERLTACEEDWAESKNRVVDAIKEALSDGVEKYVTLASGDMITITPYKRRDMPKPPLELYAKYEKFASLMKERVEDI